MENKWYAYSNGRQFGPYTWDQLQLYISEGRISPQDLVRNDQMAEWVLAGKIPGLVSLNAAAQMAAGAGSAAAGEKSVGPVILAVSLAVILIGVIAFLGIRFLIGNRVPELLAVNTSVAIDAQDRPEGITSEFTPDTGEIYVVAEFSGFTRTTPLSSVWIWEEENHEFGSYVLDMPRSSTLAIFSFTRPDNGWPVGSYRVELYREEERIDIVRFSVVSLAYTSFEFYDDFSVFDASVWMPVRGTSSDLGYGQPADETGLVIDDGQLILIQDITDNGPFLHSLPFRVESGDIVTISRQVALQPANDKLLAQMALYGTDEPTLSSTYTDQYIVVQYLYYNWDGDTYRGSWDNFVFNERKWDSDTNPLDLENPLPPIWNEWFTETIVYDTASSQAAYYINGEQVALAPAFNDFTGGFLKLVISPYGWQTGHATYMNMLEITVESSASAGR